MAFIQDNITFNNLSKVGIGSPFGNVVKYGITSEEDLKMFVDAFESTGESDYDYRNIQSVLIDWNGAQVAGKTLNTTGEVLSVLQTAYNYATTYNVKYSGGKLYDDKNTEIKVGSNVTESTVSDWGFTKNTGTVTGIKMNGTSKGTSGVVDLGTVITDISGKADKTEIPTKVSQLSNDSGFTSNTGTVTGVKINNSTKSPSNGVVDLGTVLTQHQDLSGKADKSHTHIVSEIESLSAVLSQFSADITSITTTITNLSERIAELEKHHEPVLVTGISLSQTSATLTGKNATLTLTPTITPTDATNKSVTWTSSSASVATVNGGVITPLKAGKTTITATTTDGSNKSASCNVEVKDGTTTWLLTPEEASIKEGKQKTFVMAVYSSDTFVAPNANNTAWSVQYKDPSDNSYYVSANDIFTTTSNNVSSTAVVTAPMLMSNSSATYYINATNNGYSKTAVLHVSPSAVPVTSVKLDKTSINLSGSTSAVITATVEPDNATNKSVTWNVISSNNAISDNANDNKLTITGNTIGTATIIATADGKSSTSCQVTVTQGTISINGINPSSTEIQEGDSKEFTVAYSSTMFAGTPHNFTWSCSGNTSASDLLSSTTGTTITFNAPDELGADVSGSYTTYYINVTSTQASGSVSASASVKVNRKAQATKYYWYAGQTKPTSMTSNPTPDDTNFTNNKWHTLSKDATSISKTITSGTSGNAWYIAVPTSFGFKPTATDLATPNNTWSTEGTIIINNVEYTLWKPSGTSSRQAVYMAKI